MKKLLSMLTCFVMIIGLINPVNPFGVRAAAADADVTIGTAEELVAFANASASDSYAGKTIVLTDDIDLSAVANFPMIGHPSYAFAGVFDGQGHTVKNVTISSNGGYIGFFRHLSGGTIRNLTIDTITVTATYENDAEPNGRVAALVANSHTAGATYENIRVKNAAVSSLATCVGGLVGSAFGNLSITNCSFEGSLKGVKSIGGLIGYMANGATATINDSIVLGSIEGTGAPTRTGGLVGYVNGGTVTATWSAFKGALLKDGLIGGGVVGQHGNSGKIVLENCTGYITSTRNTGMMGSVMGNEGVSGGTTLTNCYGYCAGASLAIAYNAANVTTNALSATSFSGKTIEIPNENRLLALAYLSNGTTFSGANVKLTADLDLKETENFPMIGAVNTAGAFQGTFDGQDHTIKNLTIVTDTNYAGLFRSATGTTMKNVTIDTASVTSTAGTNMARCAVLLGNSHTTASTYENIHVKNATVVSSGEQNGGIFGSFMGAATVTNCSFEGSVTGLSFVGGIVGVSANATPVIRNVTVFADVISTSEEVTTNGAAVGLIVGGANSGLTVDGCTVSGTVTGNGDNNIGGIAGRASNRVNITNTKSSAVVTGKPCNLLNLGGFVGAYFSSSANTLTISNSIFDGSVLYNESANAFRIGGFVGMAYNSDLTLTFENVLMAGTVESNAMGSTGGIFGNHAGGSGGQITINKALVTGSVSSAGGGQTGALIGNVNSHTATVTDTYYAADSCSVGDNGIGKVGDEGSASNGASSLTTAELTGVSARNAAAGLFDSTGDPYWTSIVNDTPMLASFTEEAEVTAVKFADISAYRGSAFTAPEADPELNALFAGWYEDEALTKPLAKDVTSGEAYAKFIDADVLKIRYQLDLTSGKKLRLVTTVESLDLESVGFRISYQNTANETQELDLNSTTVYETLTGFKNAEDVTYTPGGTNDGGERLFSKDSFRFLCFKLSAGDALVETINASETGITATPYWVTADGTTVTGTTRSGLKFQ